MNKKLGYSGQLSRADLLQALATDNVEQITYIAKQLGLSTVLEETPAGGGVDANESVYVVSKTIGQPFAEEHKGIRPIAGFWRLGSRETLIPSERISPVTPLASTEWKGLSSLPAPHHHLLVTPRDFIPRLLPHLQNKAYGFKPDITKLVKQVSQAKALNDIPRLPSHTSNAIVQVIDDRHTHLIPYWKDHTVQHRLLEAIHNGNIQRSVLMDGQSTPRILGFDGWQKWLPPEKGSVVMIFSDLGALSQTPETQVVIWWKLGQTLHRAGCKAIVFMPCNPTLCDARLKTLFTLEALTRTDINVVRSIDEEQQLQVNLLLDALSPTIRVEPGLLRQMRLEMAQHGKQWQINAAVESMIWQHGDIQEAHSVAATWNRDARKQRLKNFEKLSLEERRTALDVIRQWRQPLPKQIWFEEITSLDSKSRDLQTADVQAADAYFQQLSEQIQSSTFLESEIETREWLQRVAWRLPETALENETVGEALQHIKFKVSPQSTDNIDPRNLPISDIPEKQVMLYQRGESICVELFVPHSEKSMGYSPLAQLRMQHDLVRIEVNGQRLGELGLTSGNIVQLPNNTTHLTAISDREILHFDQFFKPEWAKRFWRDQKGMFAETVSSEGETYRWAWYSGVRNRLEEHRKRGVWYSAMAELVKQFNTTKRIGKIFISYARDGSHGENLAAEIQQQLQAVGFAVFRDVIGLRPGDVWHHKLEFELESSDVMVLVVSEKVRTSKWVHNEVSMAEEIGIPVIPVLAEKMRYPLWLRHLQVLNFCEILDWSLLLEAIERHADRETRFVSSFTKRNTLQTDPIVTGMPSTLEKDVGRVIPPPWASTMGDDQYGRYADINVKGVTQRFRWIEPGAFLMGSPIYEPKRNDDEILHPVQLTNGFWLADTACTQALWQVVMGSNPAYFQDDINNPVEKVSWDDVQEFIQVLNKSISGLTALLPTEAQWEYACRAGTATPFSFGDNITPLLVNYDSNYSYNTNKKGLRRQKALPVKSLPANSWGLYEMHGNVLEWCQDRLGEYPTELIIDPQNLTTGSVRRVLRGGSWNSGGRVARSAHREAFTSVYRRSHVGFRIAIAHAKIRQDHINLSPLQIGDKVLITEGPFRGLDAIFQNYDGKDRAIILLNVLNKPTKLVLSPDHFSRE